MDAVEIFGLAAIVTMVISYALEQRSSIFIFTFAIGCAMATYYAYLINSYPFLIAEAIWSLIALWRWNNVVKAR